MTAKKREKLQQQVGREKCHVFGEKNKLKKNCKRLLDPHELRIFMYLHTQPIRTIAAATDLPLPPTHSRRRIRLETASMGGGDRGVGGGGCGT